MKRQTIKEIKEQLHLVENKDDPFLMACKRDERKGVQTALSQWFKNQEKKEQIIDSYHEKNRYELKAVDNGYTRVAGIDEVGRGPLAGPVVAAAVILNPDKPIYGLDDSKKLSLAKRTELFEVIHQHAIAIGIGIVTAKEIDQMNILQATKKAMNIAASQIKPQPEFLLVDAVKLNNPIPQEVIIKGDSKSNSIAAASIIAKVTRDRLMHEYDHQYPGYGFSNHSGYGTKAHLKSLETYGATPIHRVSFSPVSKYLN